MNESASVHELFERVRALGLRTEEGRRAAQAIVRILGPDVMRLCLRRVNGKQADADDLFQETFAAILVQLERGQLPRSLGAYVASIVRRRSHQRYQRREHLTSDGGVPESPAESDIIDRLDFHTLSELLPARMRHVLAETFDGSTGSEIAQLLGTSEANVRQLRSRALAMLSKLREE